MNILQWLKYIFSDKYKKNTQITYIAIKRINELKLNSLFRSGKINQEQYNTFARML